MFQKMFNPNTVFNVVTKQVTPTTDAAYVQWLAAGNAPFEPLLSPPNEQWQVSIRRLVGILIAKGILTQNDVN